MKTQFLGLTIAAAGSIVVAAALRYSSVLSLLYDGALRGGGLSAQATAALGDIAATLPLLAQH